MAVLVADCPRCGSKSMSFDVTQQNLTHYRYDWQRWFEAFSVCRHCKQATIFILSQKEARHGDFFKKGPISAFTDSLNNFLNVERYISLRHEGIQAPPDFVPEGVAKIFNEGATCVATQCWNAAGVMFRTCVDLATRALLPNENEPGPNARTRRDLGLRLPWLFENGRLPGDLRELSTCIREDGNDGAHEGTLTREDAEDLKDFAVELLERLYTEPERLRRAEARRNERREASRES